MDKPKEPGLSDCCGGGSCCPCVWDHYFEQLELWESAQQADAEANTSKAVDKPDA